MFKYVHDEANRRAVELIVSQQVFLRSHIAPPGILPQAVEALRAGFDATMTDAQFLADAEKLRIDIAPLPGARVQELVERLYATPKDVVARAQRLITP